MTVQGVAEMQSGDYLVCHYGTGGTGTIKRWNSSGIEQQSASLANTGPNAGIWLDNANNTVWLSFDNNVLREYNQTTLVATGNTLTLTGFSGYNVDGLDADPTAPTSYFWVVVEATPPNQYLAKIDRSTGATVASSRLQVSPEGITFAGQNDGTVYINFDQEFHDNYPKGNRNYRLYTATAIDAGGDIIIDALTSSVASGGTSATSYATASIAPTANRGEYLFVHNTRTTTPATKPTVSGAGMTWVEVGSYLVSGSQRRTTVFRALNASPGSGAITIDFGGVTQTGCVWAIVEAWGINTTGSDAANSVVSDAASITNNIGNTVTGSSTGNAITLSALSRVHNATVGFLRNNTNAAVTAGTNFFPLVNLSVTGLRMVLESSVPGAASTTVDASWANQSVTSVFAALELTPPDVSARSLALLGVGS
jgi:hypothetical protein